MTVTSIFLSDQSKEFIGIHVDKTFGAVSLGSDPSNITPLTEQNTDLELGRKLVSYPDSGVSQEDGTATTIIETTFDYNDANTYSEYCLEDCTSSVIQLPNTVGLVEGMALQFTRASDKKLFPAVIKAGSVSSDSIELVTALPFVPQIDTLLESVITIVFLLYGSGVTGSPGTGLCASAQKMGIPKYATQQILTRHEIDLL